MQKFLFLMALVLMFSQPALADTETFVLNTDANGNATDQDNIPFGTFTLINFTSSHSFANVQVLLDGSVVFDNPVTAGQSYAVNKIAKKTMQLVGKGGPANTAVEVTVNYTWTAMATSRDTETFQLKTDANGDAQSQEKIPFGTFTLNGFTSSHSFANVQVLLDGKVTFNDAVTGGQNYSVNGSAKSTMDLIAKAGPPNTSVTVTVQYVWGARDSRDTTSFDLTTDADGYAEDGDNIPFGTFNLDSFYCSDSFANVKVLLDDKVNYDGAVTSGQTYKVGASGKKTLKLLASGGPKSATVKATVIYTWSPFTAVSRDTARDTETFTLTTDSTGYAEDSDNIPFGTFTIHSFSSTHSFNNVQVLLDANIVFEALVTANQSYSVNASGRRTLMFKAYGGPANTTVTVTVNYTWSALTMLASEKKIVKWIIIDVTDLRGNIHTQNGWKVQRNVELVGFTSSLDFAKFMLLLDEEPIFPSESSTKAGVEGEKFYCLHRKVAPGEHTLEIFGSGAKPGQKVEFTIYYR